MRTNIAILLMLSILCFSLFPWRQRAETCFQPQRYAQRTLILDAGHGGEDGGAVSVTGTPESQINLAIVLKMEQFCGLFGIRTILTRSDDTSLRDSSASTLAEMKRTDLLNRVALIEDTEQAVLISIHQNYFAQSDNSGAQVFYAPTGDSESWAAHCQALLVEQLDPNNHRLSKQITEDIYLMNHITCPAILVECGFLSNAEEAQRLEDEVYQTELALTVLNAYMTYPFSTLY